MGATLRASLSALDDADGLSGATFTYQWLADDEEIQDATNSTYVLDADNEGQTIKVRVSFTDDAGNEETLTSAPAATAVPAKTADGRTKPPPAPLNLTARANDDGSVTVSWDAPNDDSITGYRVLRRQPGEAEFSMAESEVHTGGTETTYTDDHLTLDVASRLQCKSDQRGRFERAVQLRQRGASSAYSIDMGLGASHHLPDLRRWATGTVHGSNAGCVGEIRGPCDVLRHRFERCASSRHHGQDGRSTTRDRQSHMAA